MPLEIHICGYPGALFLTFQAESSMVPYDNLCGYLYKNSKG